MPARFRRVALVAAGVVLAGTGAAAGASGIASAAAPAGTPSPTYGQPSASNPAGGELGVVPPRNQAANKSGTSGGNLSYHNGPVEHTNTVYAIYWVPSGYSVQSGYRSLIDGFFNNVGAAGANGAKDNVYYSDTQYYDNVNGKILYSSSLGASFLDTDSLPPSACSDTYTSVCLSDAQIQSEITTVATHNQWTLGPTAEVFMFTAEGVGSCYSTSSCAFSQYCAYHSHFGSGNSVTLYANMPYADTVPAACDAGQHPNNNDADATINVTSHEHNETITDEQGNAWYDRRGYEDGDKCAWNFGTPLGGTSHSEYNQVIGSGTYYLQQEWSNHSSACVLTGL